MSDDDWAPLEALSQRAARPDPGFAGRVLERGREVRNRRRVATGAGLSAAVVVLGVGAVALPLDFPDGKVNGAVEVTRYDGVSGEHVNGPIEYEQSPPVGGDHNATWQNCGFYAEPIADEYAVHSLEHGAVWITYAPNLPEEDLKVLREAMGSSGYVLVSPYAEQDSPVALSAWGVQLEVDSVDDPRIDEFLDTYVLGPQTQEQNAACAGGTSATGDEAQASLEPVDTAVGDPMLVAAALRHVLSGGVTVLVGDSVCPGDRGPLPLDDCEPLTTADRDTIAAELAETVEVRFVDPPTTGQRLVAVVGVPRFNRPDQAEVQVDLAGGFLSGSGQTYVLERAEDGDWQVTGTTGSMWIS
jgi:hypothetical protein